MNVFARLRKMGKAADLFIFSGEPAIVVVGSVVDALSWAEPL